MPDVVQLAHQTMHIGQAQQKHPQRVFVQPVASLQVLFKPRWKRMTV